MDDSENKQARTKTGLCLSSEAAGGAASRLSGHHVDCRANSSSAIT